MQELSAEFDNKTAKHEKERKKNKKRDEKEMKMCKRDEMIDDGNKEQTKMREGARTNAKNIM